MAHPEQERPQVWEMVAHERSETLGNWRPAWEWPRFPFPSWIIHRLAVPVAREYEDLPTFPRAGTDPQPGLPNLPADILLMLVDICTINDLYTLSLCCRNLRYYFRAEVYRRFRPLLAPWANTPLTCAGDRMFHNPPGITTDISNLPEGSIPGISLRTSFVHTLPANLTAYHLMQFLGCTNVVNSSTTCLSPPARGYES